MRGARGVWLIGGPTASGKSTLALALAEASGGVLVNADSMQLYRDLRVLTARPSADDEARVPHRLFGVADAEEAWSVGRWLRAALPELARIAGESRPAIVVGGTGLYFNALTRGLAEVPAISASVRDASSAMLERVGEGDFRKALRGLGERNVGAIAAGDRQRLIRAHAVAVGTGRPLSAWRRDTLAPLSARDWRGVVVEPPRPELYARCDARLDGMLERGALDEVATLTARGLGSDLPIMKALGVREFAAHLSGALTLAQATEDAKRATRNYAKRQSTWFRNQTPDWPRVDPTDPKMVLALLTASFQAGATDGAHF